ncbi:MAG: hypothetical protein ACLSAH_21090 [Bilophila wadsworthia]
MDAVGERELTAAAMLSPRRTYWDILPGMLASTQPSPTQSGQLRRDAFLHELLMPISSL